MERESYKTLSEKAAAEITEIMPWDLEELLAKPGDLMVLDVRERVLEASSLCTLQAR